MRDAAGLRAAAGRFNRLALGAQIPLVEVVLEVAHRTTIVCSPRGTSSPMTVAPGISPAIQQTAGGLRVGEQQCLVLVDGGEVDVRRGPSRGCVGCRR